MPNASYTYLSSGLPYKGPLGGNVDDLVPPLAARLLKERARQPHYREGSSREDLTWRKKTSSPPPPWS